MGTDGYCDGCGEQEDDLEYAVDDFVMKTSENGDLKRYYGYTGYTPVKVLAGKGLCTRCAINAAVDVARGTEEAALRALGPDIEARVRTEVIRVLSDGKVRTTRRILQRVKSLWQRDNAAEEHIVSSMIIEAIKDVSDPMPPKDGRPTRRIRPEFLNSGAVSSDDEEIRPWKKVRSDGSLLDWTV